MSIGRNLHLWWNFFFHPHKMFNITMFFIKAKLIYLIKCITCQDDVMWLARIFFYFFLNRYLYKETKTHRQIQFQSTGKNKHFCSCLMLPFSVPFLMPPCGHSRWWLSPSLPSESSALFGLWVSTDPHTGSFGVQA